MNPQVTMVATTALNARLAVTAKQGVGARKPAAVNGPAIVTHESVPDAAERDRQDALAFLHKLVMG